MWNEAIDVAKAFVSVSSHFGFSHEILSDLASEFLSDNMKTFLNEFGISDISTNPYHSATNGSCK